MDFTFPIILISHDFGTINNYIQYQISLALFEINCTIWTSRATLYALIRDQAELTFLFKCISNYRIIAGQLNRHSFWRNTNSKHFCTDHSQKLVLVPQSALLFILGQDTCWPWQCETVLCRCLAKHPVLYRTCPRTADNKQTTNDSRQPTADVVLFVKDNRRTRRQAARQAKASVWVFCWSNKCC